MSSTIARNGNGPDGVSHVDHSAPIVTKRQILAELARRDELKRARDRRYRIRKRARQQVREQALWMAENRWAS